MTQAAKSSLYTRQGDHGTSSLFGTSGKLSKSEPVFAALGDVDELSAHLGVAMQHMGPPHTDWLLEVQERLMDIGSALATPLGSSQGKRYERARFASDTEKLEQAIDALDAQLPKLENFVLPRGTAASVQLHVARTVCRRAERTVCTLVEHGNTEPSALQYLNRLSDLLFALARYYNQSPLAELAYRKGDGAFPIVSEQKQ